MDLNPTTDITLTADCIKSVSNFGSTTYMNICTGTSSVVPWGAMDIAAPVIAVLVAITVMGFAVWATNAR